MCHNFFEIFHILYLTDTQTINTSDTFNKQQMEIKETNLTLSLLRDNNLHYLPLKINLKFIFKLNERCEPIATGRPPRRAIKYS